MLMLGRLAGGCGYIDAHPPPLPQWLTHRAALLLIAAEPPGGAGGAGGGTGGNEKNQDSHSGPTATVPVSYVPAAKDALSVVGDGSPQLA